MSDAPAGPICRTPACRTPHEPGYAGRGLCGWCEDRGREAIRALPGDHTDLQPLIWVRSAAGPDRAGPAPFGPTIPVDLYADALAREIAYTATLWEEVVRDRAGLAEPPRASTAAALARACRILDGQFSVLLALGPWDHESAERCPTTWDGPDVVVALTRLHRRARAHIGVDGRSTTVAGACPNCQAEQLRHRDGGDVRCVRCRTTWPYEAYLDYIAVVPLAGSA